MLNQLKKKGVWGGVCVCERQPYAVTSRIYQEVFEKKKLAKHRAEEEN